MRTLKNKKASELALGTIIAIVLVLIALLVFINFYFAIKTAVGGLPG